MALAAQSQLSRIEAPRPSWPRHVHVRINEPGGPAKEHPGRSVQAAAISPPSLTLSQLCLLLASALLHVYKFINVKKESEMSIPSFASMTYDDT